MPKKCGAWKKAKETVTTICKNTANPSTRLKYVLYKSPNKKGSVNILLDSGNFSNITLIFLLFYQQFFGNFKKQNFMGKILMKNV